MVKLLITVQDRDKVEDLNQFGSIVYVSRYLNVVGLETRSIEVVPEIRNHHNVLSVEVAGQLQYQV